MQFQSISSIKALLEKYGAKPSKRFGQNFLVDSNVLGNIVEAANIQRSDTIIEVGPGMGVLTAALAAKAGKVIAIEKDRNMVEILKETASGLENVEVVELDILQYNPPRSPYSVVANIPYYLTSPLIRTFLESEHQPEKLLLMVQKEVAERICARPPRMSLLAVSVQYYAQPKIIHKVSKQAFWPVPKVDSAMIEILPNKKAAKNADAFFAVVRAGFSQPRKQLANNLATALQLPRQTVEAWLQQNNLQPKQRAETLTVQDWISLSCSRPA